MAVLLLEKINIVHYFDIYYRARLEIPRSNVLFFCEKCNTCSGHRSKIFLSIAEECCPRVGCPLVALIFFGVIFAC